MSADQLIALVAILIGATSTMVTAYLAHRRAHADREHARRLAADQHEHSIRLARDERLFASRREVYEEVLRRAGALFLGCTREFGNVSQRAADYALAKRGMLAPDRIGEADNPVPPEPTTEEWRELLARLGAVGSSRVEDALETARHKAYLFGVAARAWERTCREDHPFSDEAHAEATAAGEALDEAERAFLELEAIIKEELIGRPEQPRRVRIDRMSDYF